MKSRVFNWLKSGGGGGHLPAVGYMLITVIGISIIPLLITIGNGSENPFLFNAGWRFGVALGCLFFLFAFYRKLALNRAVLSLIIKRVACWSIVLSIAGNCEYVFFAWSDQFIDISVTTVVYEIWPLFLIALVAWLYRQDSRYHNVNVSTFLLLIPAFVGITFVTASQAGGFSNLMYLTGAFSETLWGILLALAAAVLAPMMAFGFKWSSDLSSELGMRNDTGASVRSIEMFCAIIAFLISSSGASAINFAIGVARNETINLDTLVISLVGGAFANAIAGIAWRKANFTTDRLDVNAIAYSVPVASLLWLIAFADIEIPVPAYLIIGTIAIVTTNIIANFEPERLMGFKSLLIGVWASGTVVYLRDTIFNTVLRTDWHWTSGNYFEAIALSATVFTLLLAFRVARLVSRTSSEESRTFSVFRKLDLLAQRRVVSSDVLNCILRIDAPASPLDLKNAYTEARNIVAGVCPLNDADRQILTEAEGELDALVRSKQLGLVLGELFALLIFAGITISLALFSRPNVSDGWTRLLVDLFAMLTSAVIVFLAINVWDLHRERQEPKLELRPEYGDYAIRFPGTERRLIHMVLSVTVGLVIIVTYAALLAHKWLGWLG